MFPGYYNMPVHPQYPQPSPQYLPAGYYSAPVMQVATTPYHTSMQNGTAYNNPTFENPQFQTAPSPHDSAFVSSEYYDDDDYYDANPGIHQSPPIESDITFGNDDFDPLAAQFCGANVSNMFVTNSLAYSSLTDRIASPLPPMANLQTLPITPLGRIISHWLELCSGNMLAGLAATLLVGITVHRVSLVERNRTVSTMAANRLAQLQAQHPSQLSLSAISQPFGISQDVSILVSEHLKHILPIDFIFATPPCQAFSIAGSTPG